MALEVDGVNINSVEIDGVALKTVEFDGVLLLAPPTIKTQPVSSTILDNQEVVLKVVAESLGKDIKYQWQKSGTNISGATAANYTHPKSAAGAYKYACVVSNKMGTIKTNEVTVTVNKSWVANYRLLIGKLSFFPGEVYTIYGFYREDADGNTHGDLQPRTTPSGAVVQILGTNQLVDEPHIAVLNIMVNSAVPGNRLRVSYDGGAYELTVPLVYDSTFSAWAGRTDSVHFWNYMKARQGSWIDIRILEG